MIGGRTLGHGLTDLHAHPWRAALSGVSLCVGVLAVVAVFAISAVTAEVFVATEEQRTGRLVTAGGEVALVDPDVETISAMLRAAEPVRATGGAAAITVHPTALTGIASAYDPPRRIPLSAQPLVLVAGDLAGVRRLPMLTGRWFHGAAQLPVELVTNLAAAREWGGVGTELMVSASDRQPPVRAVVTGVVADGEGDPVIYAPLVTLLHVQPYLFDDFTAELLLHHPSASVATLTRVGEQVAFAGRTSLTGPLRRIDTVNLLLERLRSQQLAFLVAALVALAVAALGMLNIGLANVNERARELVIRRAVGATRGDLIRQVLVSAAIVALIASVVAIGAAWLGLQWWVPRRIPPVSAIEPPGLPWTAVGWGMATALLTTLAGSLLPALVAARLDVASALRD